MHKSLNSYPKEIPEQVKIRHTKPTATLSTSLYQEILISFSQPHTLRRAIGAYCVLQHETLSKNTIPYSNYSCGVDP